MNLKQEVSELQQRITQLKIENAKLKHENDTFLTIRNTVSKTMLGSIDTLKINKGAKISTKINFRENESYMACLETAHESLGYFFKTKSELCRAVFRVGLMWVLIEFGCEAEKSDVHYGLPRVTMLGKIKKILGVMLKLASIEHDNIMQKADKDFEERKSFALECMKGNIIDKGKLDALGESRDGIIDVFTPDFSVDVDGLKLPDSVDSVSSVV